MVKSEYNLQAYSQIMFKEYFKESIESLLGRICDSELLVPRLTREEKFEDIAFNRADLKIVIEAILYKPEEELQATRRNLQLEIQSDKGFGLDPFFYRQKERKIYILNDLLFNGVITKSTRTLLHQQP